MEFNDELAGGVVLVRPALQSPDYVTGVSGWAIKIDGSAEFNDVVIRGGTVVSGLALYYNGTPATGNLILSIAAAAGTDAYGNAYPAGLGVFGTDGDLTVDDGVLLLVGSNGSQVALSTGGVGGASVFLTPQNLAGATWLDGRLATTLGASNRPGTVVSSPAEDSNGSHSSISLFGGGPTTADTYILFAADRFSFNNLLQVFGDLEVSGKLTASNIQTGSVSVSFAALSQTTVAVTFPTAYPVGTVPSVVTNINSGSGTTVRWGSRAISVTNTGFTLFVFKGDAADPAQTWTNIAVQYTAIG